MLPPRRILLTFILFAPLGTAACADGDIALEDSFAGGNDGPFAAQDLGVLVEGQGQAITVLGSFSDAGEPDLTDEDWYTVDVVDHLGLFENPHIGGVPQLWLAVVPGAHPDHLEAQQACEEQMITNFDLWYACRDSQTGELEPAKVSAGILSLAPLMPDYDGEWYGAYTNTLGIDFSGPRIYCEDRADDSGRAYIRIYSNDRRNDFDGAEFCSDYELTLSLIKPDSE
jgi:hypothetical protein